MKRFNPLASYLTIKFNCSCGELIEETIMDLPKANYLADNAEESENSIEHTIICPKCGKEYTCNVYVNMYEGNVDVEER